MEHAESVQTGWREKKRQETLRRITEQAIGLFIAQGYEATTLDAIAEAAGISRRTFFYYFESKEQILASWQLGLPEALRKAVLAEGNLNPPLVAVRNAHAGMLAHHDPERALAIDKILRSNDQLRAKNQVKYLQMEQATLEALVELWPSSERRIALRMVARTSVAALRMALECWADEQGREPLTYYLEKAYEELGAEFGKTCWSCSSLQDQHSA